MVGSQVLTEALLSTDVERVFVYGRTPVPMVDPLKEFNLDYKPRPGFEARYKEYNSPNFLSFPKAFLEELNRVEVVYFCLGVYTGAVEREEFRKITYEYPVALARALKKAGAKPHFVLLSGQGADRKERSRMMFAKDKGAAENALSKLFPGNFTALRPSYIYPVLEREEPNKNYERFRKWYPFLKILGKNFSITSNQLAQTMFYVGMHKSEEQIPEVLENKHLIQLHKTIEREP